MRVEENIREERNDEERRGECGRGCAPSEQSDLSKLDWAARESFERRAEGGGSWGYQPGSISIAETILAEP